MNSAPNSDRSGTYPIKQQLSLPIILVWLAEGNSIL